MWTKQSLRRLEPKRYALGQEKPIPVEGELAAHSSITPKALHRLLSSTPTASSAVGNYFTWLLSPTG
jgi:hypothetical protein